MCCRRRSENKKTPLNVAQNKWSPGQVQAGVELFDVIVYKQEEERPETALLRFISFVAECARSDRGFPGPELYDAVPLADHEDEANMDSRPLKLPFCAEEPRFDSESCCASRTPSISFLRKFSRVLCTSSSLLSSTQNQKDQQR